MPRFGALFVEEARIFNGDARFASEDAHQFEVSLIKGAFVFGKNGHHADGVVIRDERNAAVAAVLENGLHAEFFDFRGVVLANKHRLTGADDVLGDVVPRGTAARGLELAANHFNVELHFIAQRVKRADVKILHVEEAAELFPNFAEKVFLVEGRTQSAANLIKDVKLLGAPGSLLDEVAILDGHADLVAEREKEAVFGGSKAA